MDPEWMGRIGETAGKIWSELNDHGEATFTMLKKTTRETDSAVHEALGWLAREGKVESRLAGRNRTFWLNGH